MRRVIWYNIIYKSITWVVFYKLHLYTEDVLNFQFSKPLKFVYFCLEFILFTNLRFIR